MIKKGLTVLGCVTLAACAAPMPGMAPAPAAPEAAAPATPQTAKERFVVAAEANGCVVNESTAPAILSGATLSAQDLARIMDELRTEGRGEISPDGQSFRVTSGACATA